MAYLTKQGVQILSDALNKLSTNTSITNISPGSVARALTELVTSQLGDFYNILDFNTSQGVLSSASGISLDMIGSLFNVSRKGISDLAAIDRSLGSFYFYLDQPYRFDILIPNGTNIFTDNTIFVGNQFTYTTVGDSIIPAGHTKAYATIRPNSTSAVFTAGINTLTIIDPNLQQPTGTTVRCANPKPIEAQTLQESDSSYRTRIVAAVRTAAGGTLEAVRMAGLNVAGVRDIKVRDTPYGLGSFEVLVVTEDNLLNDVVFVSAQQACEATRPVGVRMYIRQPELLPVDVDCSIVISNVDVNTNTANLTSRTQVAIQRFLNGPLVGTPLVYNQLIQAIMDATDSTLDVIVNSFAVNGSQVLRKNYQPNDDQQLIPGSIRVSIASS